jgi:hypothetical protein
VTWLLLACAGSPADTASACETDDDGAYPTWASFGERFFTGYCDSCHTASAPDRFGAPEAYVFDTEEQVATLSPLVRLVVLDEESMPFGGGVPDEDLLELDRYLACLDHPP